MRYTLRGILKSPFVYMKKTNSR